MHAGANPVTATLYTGAAMVAFAGNSVICRMALADDTIDPATFTTLRLVSGAIALLLIVAVRGGLRGLPAQGSWTSAGMLFLYAVGFSFAYMDLSAGTGALILFGFVQGTMIVMAMLEGNRPIVLEWLGWLAAFIGLVWLLLPGVEAPSAGGATLMATAGIAWGAYSIRGKGESDALGSTAANFMRSVPLALAVFVVESSRLQITWRGAALALISGALTSGVGYVVWYAALGYLSSIRAALVQLSVPAIAALGGVILLAEPLSMRLVTAGALILGGICVALLGKSRQSD